VTESNAFAFNDPDLPIEERVNDLVSRMTLEEKCGQMLHEAPAIERLGVPAYNWWNECLHGVARAGIATVFPQAIGLAAMWNDEFLFRIATVISTEARAKHHEFLREGDRNYYAGLTFWSPNINIFRDPRWGRGQETYGECPFLTSRLGVAFCKGLQGDDPKYLKLVATAKHYAVHSGPEAERHAFNAKVSLKDLRETYLPAFHACVTEARACSVMGAYNRTNGEVCCGSRTLLHKVLREEWGFDGYVVSDCWAIRDFHESHKVTANAVESVALAVRNGCDLNCGCAYQKLTDAVAAGLLAEPDIDRAVRRLMTARMRLGMFDPPERVAYARIPYEANDCAEHRAMALEAARQSIVLLKNDGVLPLSKEIGSIAVIGPNADNRDVLKGNYHGTPSRAVTPLEGIRAAVSRRTRVVYAEGCQLTGERIAHCAPSGRISEAVSLARRADAVVLVLGLSSQIEGEQGDASNSDAAGDKLTLNLPGLQQRLLEAVHAVGKPVVLCIMSGSALAPVWADEHVPAILQAWYPGQEGGTALAEILFGDVSPAGRLPVTFPRSLDQVPDFRDYAMKNRTYRYIESEPLYPFGFGLSYTRFEYGPLKVSRPRLEANEVASVEVTVTNAGPRAGHEVVQLYVTDLEASVKVPNCDLRGFRRIHLRPGESRTVSFILTPKALSLINEQGRRVLEPGRFRLSVGGSQPDRRSEALMGRATAKAEIEVVGKAIELPY
jgi:beta-glucosidase